MTKFLTIVKPDHVTLAFAVLIAGVLIFRFAAPPLPVLFGCIGAVLASAGLKAARRKR